MHVCIDVDRKSSAGSGFEMDIDREIIVFVLFALSFDLRTLSGLVLGHKAFDAWHVRVRSLDNFIHHTRHTHTYYNHHQAFLMSIRSPTSPPKSMLPKHLHTFR